MWKMELWRLEVKEMGRGNLEDVLCKSKKGECGIFRRKIERKR
jgi:hypothetical protein